MSETPFIPPNAAHPAGRKPPSRGCLIVCGIIVGVLTYIFTGPLYPPGVVASFWQSHSMWMMGRALNSYADDHDGQLPPAFQELFPKYLQKENLFAWGYHDERGDGTFEWLYYPLGKLNDLPRDTIILAAPRTSFDFLWRRQRLVRYRGLGFHHIPEADFQRLIREQNSPTSFPSPDH